MAKAQKNTQKGMSLAGFIVLIALVPLIVWSLNFMISRDFSEPKASAEIVKKITNNNADQDNNLAVATTSEPTAPITIIATSTAIKTATSTIKIAVTKPPLTETSSQATVTFTDKGFSPASVTVVRGQSVTFVNNSSGKMWIAANPFPSSSEYPAFNEKEGVASGESWTFTFDESGTWFYHNHYSPAQGAKVVVSWK